MGLIRPIRPMGLMGNAKNKSPHLSYLSHRSHLSHLLTKKLMANSLKTDEYQKRYPPVLIKYEHYLPKRTPNFAYPQLAVPPNTRAEYPAPNVNLLTLKPAPTWQWNPLNPPKSAMPIKPPNEQFI